jgi:NTE family protein
MTAFVLAGGGSRGAVQVGMLAELAAHGIVADRVYGASVGAVNGAAYAADPSPDEVGHPVDVWSKLTGSDVFPRGRMDGPWMFFQQRPSVHANSGLRKIIEEGINYERLEDATVPIEVVTTSLSDGLEHWITQGPAVEAILASAALPAIFPPVVIDGYTLVDGGVVNNVPISRAIAAGATRIYVLLCGPLHYHPRESKRPVEAVLSALFVAIHARFVRELAVLPDDVEVVVFSGGGEPTTDYRDFSGTAEMIAQGREEVASTLDWYRGTSRPLDRPQGTPIPAGRGGPGFSPASSRTGGAASSRAGSQVTVAPFPAGPAPPDRPRAAVSGSDLPGERRQPAGPAAAAGAPFDSTRVATQAPEP